MRISGFTFIRNGIRFGYPFRESLRSLLPLCDEIVVAVGNSDDDTRSQILAIGDPRIRIIDTVWDDALRTGGRVLAQQTDLALDAVTGDWAIYLQGDEVLHERDEAVIRRAMERYRSDLRVEGLLFRYVHFYGSYEFIGDSRRWYRREVRVVRPQIGVRSWGDAQGFRIAGRKLRVKEIDAEVFHYGWVKPPAIQQLKQQHFNKLWHPDEWVAQNVKPTAEYDYASGGRLRRFDGTHPAVMKPLVTGQDWTFTYEAGRVRHTLRERLLDRIEGATGWRIGEYRNYKII